MTQQSKFDYLVKTLDELKPVIQATHDQTIKTNGRVNRLEDWRDEQNITVKGLVRTNNMITGILAFITFVSAGFITFLVFSVDNYMENRDNKIKADITETLLSKLEPRDVTVE